MNEKNNMTKNTQANERTWQEIMDVKPKFLSMPMSTDSQERTRQSRWIFSGEYLEMLKQLFDDEFMSIARTDTEIGMCVALDLHPGAVWDYGSQMKAFSGSAEEINVMIRLAKAKKWPGIHISGSEEFKERVFIHAVLSGAYKPEEITGYEPSARALEIIGMAGLKPSKKSLQKPDAEPEEASNQTPAKKLKV